MGSRPTSLPIEMAERICDSLMVKTPGVVEMQVRVLQENSGRLVATISIYWRDTQVGEGDGLLNR